jgi:hypothetical protein
MEIKLNSWNGTSYDNDNICHFCQKLTTTTQLSCSPVHKISICKGCLLNIVKEIDQKVLESKTF